MAFTEDLAVFLDDDDFGSVATHGGSSKNVIFDPSFVNQDGIQSGRKVALGRKSDFSSVAQAQSVVIDSVTYTVAEFQHDPPDFPGFTLLVLKV